MISTFQKSENRLTVWGTCMSVMQNSTVRARCTDWCVWCMSTAALLQKSMPALKQTLTATYMAHRRGRGLEFNLTSE